MLEIVASDGISPEELAAFNRRMWHAEFVVAHGEQIRPTDLPGFVALDDGRVVGHAAYRIAAGSCELVAIAADPQHSGIGSELLGSVVAAARTARCSRIWLTTTNDNLDALRFYQRRGFELSALRRGVVAEARRTLKPDLPATGSYDIPMRDELDLELSLSIGSTGRHDVLATFPSYATLPTNDVARLRQFYERLGFTVMSESAGGVYFQTGDGTMFAVTRQSGRASGTHTQLGFRVRGIEAIVADLRSRGVDLEDYEVPRTVDGIADVPVGRAAWFRDPDGNLIGLVEFQGEG